ncbi:MAG: tetratricopeptide repeat protein [Candidatus Omnitrophica bacterium]|nr:tetratricopeptide repeat protein [Candidatus Omnitrophota bacterium]
MGGLLFGLCLTASAGSTQIGLLPGIAAAAKSNAPQSVKAQADALYRMARNELRAGDQEKAIALLQQVLSLNPQHKKAREELEKLNNAGVSLEPQPSLITSDNLSAQEMMNVADAMIKDGDYAGAESLLLKAQKKAKTDAEKKRVEAYLSAISKEREKAAKVQQEVVEYNNSQLDSLIQKGVIYLENDQYDKAEVELQRAKMIAPDDKRVDQLLSQVYAKRGQVQKGEAVQQQAALAQQTKEQASAADSLFREGVVLYKEGRIIEAVDKWNQALQAYPDHAMAQTYLANTEGEYQKALKEKNAAAELAAEEAAFEQKLDQPIMQYSTEGESLDIKNVLSTLSKISGLNVVMGENLAGNVAFEVKNTTVREVLNLLQKQYGFVWSREKGTVFVEQGFKTKIFSLTEGQYKTIEMILSDPSVLEDSSKNLRTILYGPGDEFNVPGKQLYLNRTSQSLLVTDTETNIRRVEAFLKDMPELIQEKRPVETRTYRLDKDIAKEIYEIVKLVLYKGQGGYDLTNPNRALYLEPNSSVLIVIDYPENIEEVEKILSQNQITQQLEEGTLEAKQFSITDMDDVESTPEALLRREEFVTAISDILVQMLYGREGRDAAKLQGRMIVPNPDRGTIDVVDTRENIRRVENYLNSVKGESTQDLIIETYPIQHVDVFTIADALAYMFFDSQQSTRSMFLEQDSFQSLGTSEEGDSALDAGGLYQEGSRDRFNLAGGGGSTDLLQFLAVRFYPDVNTNSIVVLTPDEETLQMVSRIITTFDKPQRMIELETRSVRVSLNDLRSINFDYTLTDPFLDKISTNPENMMMDVSMSTESSSGLNLGVHTFGTSRLDFVMNLLESQDSFQVLNAPKVLTLANPVDPPLVFVGQQIPYADSADFDDQGDDDPTNNRLVINYERTFTGTMLAAIPFILNDDHIYLELNPQVIEPGERLPIEISGETPPGAEVPNVGPLLLNQQYIRTTVRMKNGSTMVMGGLITERENESKDMVPFLSKIPFLGNLFTDRNVEKEKISTLYFITARIIEPSL